MSRVVFNTVVFVRALINPHGVWGRLVFQHYHQYQLCLSPAIVEEILAVLHWPELTKKFRTLPSYDVASVLKLFGQATIVHPKTIMSVSRDPNDNIFLATAHTAKAEFLVTEDNDLLILKKYKSTAIINTKTFLGILEKD